RLGVPPTPRIAQINPAPTVNHNDLIGMRIEQTLRHRRLIHIQAARPDYERLITVKSIAELSDYLLFGTAPAPVDFAGESPNRGRTTGQLGQHFGSGPESLYLGKARVSHRRVSSIAYQIPEVRPFLHSVAVPDQIDSSEHLLQDRRPRGSLQASE